MKNVPKRIYLQVGEVDTDDFNVLYSQFITWSSDKINDNDIEYKLSTTRKLKNKEQQGINIVTDIHQKVFNEFIDRHYSHAAYSYRQNLKDSFDRFVGNINLNQKK